MKAYRRYFIRLNMLLVGAVLLTVLVFLGIYTARSEYTNMRQTMLETLEPFNGENGTFSFTPGTPKDKPAGEPKNDTPPSENKEPEERTKPEGESGVSERNKPSQKKEETDTASGRCVTVFYEDGTATVISGSGEAETENLISAAGTAVQSEETFGYLKTYGLYYLREGSASSAKVCLYPAAYLRRSCLKTGAYLSAAFALTMLACYFISRHISKIAVRPVQQAMEREKQFVADVSHDLKTPMAVMQSCGHIITETPAKTVAEVMPWLEKSENAMQNMRSLIDDMLTLSAMDAAQSLTTREKVDFSSVVTKAALQMDAMAYDRGIEFTYTIEENITVMGDAGALLRVAAGLMENALKYEPQNGRVTATLTSGNGKAVLTVKNDGTCIAPEDLPHIFERFYRSDKARTAQQGHGLGLAILHRTVELMHGKTEVSSSPETGTVFTVTLGENGSK